MGEVEPLQVLVGVVEPLQVLVGVVEPLPIGACSGTVAYRHLWVQLTFFCKPLWCSGLHAQGVSGYSWTLAVGACGAVELLPQASAGIFEFHSAGTVEPML